MFNLDNIISDGFSMDKGDSRDLAFLSLKIALKAYFSTYQAMKNSIRLFDPTLKIEQKRIDSYHSDSYIEAYAETIVHFQHFAELICKEILRENHELLAVDATNKPEIFHKLLKGEDVNPSDYEGLKTIEFSTTLDRLCKLIDADRIDRTAYEFILKNKLMLCNLNTLRNRIWHRGTYILRYPALDKFIGYDVLPFVRKVLSLDNFKYKESIWKYKELNCPIDPIDSIMDEFSQGNYKLEKIAILKELGRAAYENPIEEFNIFPSDTKVKVDEEIPEITQYDWMNIANVLNCQVLKCPVCGINALVVFEDQTEEYEDDTGDIKKIWRFSREIKCMCCSYSLLHDVGNPSTYGLKLDDYWYEKELSWQKFKFT